MESSAVENQAAALDLMPSQVIRASSGQSANASLDPNHTNDLRPRNGSPNRSRGRKQPRQGGVDSGNTGDKESSVENHARQQQEGNREDSSTTPDQARSVPSRRRRGGKSKGKSGSKPIQDNKVSSEKTQADDGQEQQQKQSGKKQKNKRRNRSRAKHPWRMHVPEEAVDPITLDPIRSLNYPPFALVADEPYEAVEVWPIPPSNEDVAGTGTTPLSGETAEERQRRIIAEQWGKHTESSGAELDEGDKKKSPVVSETGKRHYNLYDGRALAYYMVSQLQFIDPLNRRDLTRDELVNLDRYLRRHGFIDLNVTEAYDEKGVSISSAGAAANTAAGRAAILQQEASVLLNALFGGSSVSYTTQSSASSPNNLARQYRAHEAGAQQRIGERHDNNRRSLPVPQDRAQDDTGIYGGTGFLVIDDDMNPGLRGDAPVFVPSAQEAANGTTAVNTLWSASHIAARYGHNERIREHDFPSLGATAAVPQSSTQDQEDTSSKKRLPASKTLSKIGGAVKKTDPEELQRQFEAREAARRRAMMSNLTYGSNPASWSTAMTSASSIPSQTATAERGGPTDSQLERNRAFAEALNIAPTTVRHGINSGWARPSEGRIELDEFGNELVSTVYPDSLILQARERMALLTKLEKKWKNFLADDSAGSLPLNAMDRPTRTFVHEYSDYWKLHTESFDPEPKRYIHCVKLRDTSAPYPLLSDAARAWRGPRPILQGTRPITSEHPSQQTAGQSTGGRDLPPPPDRTPLQLKPRSGTASVAQVAPPSGGISIGGAPSRTMVEAGGLNSSRFASLSTERERPKLELQKRTLPLELPPYDPQPKGFDVAEELQNQKQRAAEKERREREQAQREQRVLEAAFASDDERVVRRSSSSSWEEAEELFPGSDED